MQSEDQDAIQSTVRSFLDAEMPMQWVRDRFDGGFADALPDVWRRAGELGFFGLGIAEERGGSGFALTEEMILFNELGRTLAPGPWLGSVLATHALAEAADHQQLLRGESACAAAAVLDGDEFAVAGGRASGELHLVPDAVVAASLLVRSREGWFHVERRPGGWRDTTLRPFDPTRPACTVALDAAPCRAVATGDAAHRLDRIAAVLACAEAVGGIEQTVAMSVEYCKVRTQFDRPIGSFQAVKHRCADMAVRAEVARSATIYAAICVRDDRADAAHQVAVAQLLCADAYLQNAADNIQNHGGMGFTWECDAHLYMKRAHGFDVACGGRRGPADQLVAELRA